MELVLGLDLGTTNFKASLYTREGVNVGIGRVPILSAQDDGIHSELSVERFFALLARCMELALVQAQANREDIKAVSYSSQANSFLLLAEDERPLTPLILWPDHRGEPPGKEFLDFSSRQDLLETTGMGLFSPLAAISKILWFRDNQPDIWQKTSRIMSISDYLSYALTGEKVGDSGTASLLGLWSLRDNCWWREAFDQLKLDSRMFSLCLPPGTKAGCICEAASQRFPLPKGIPFAVGGLDHYMAALGAGIGTYADYSESTGTILALCSLVPCFNPVPHFAYGPGLTENRPYYRLSFQDEGGVILENYRNEYARTFTFSELSDLAEVIQPGSNGVYSLLKPRPFSLENNFYGQSSSTTSGQYTRAIMESVAASLKKLFEVDMVPEKILATGGGAQSDVWLQIKADITGSTMIALENSELACTGAAKLAACATAWASTPKELDSSWIRIRRKIEPKKEAYDFYQNWFEGYLSLHTPNSTLR